MNEMECICVLPPGSVVHTIKGEILVRHPDRPLSRINVAKKCLEPYRVVPRPDEIGYC